MPRTEWPSDEPVPNSLEEARKLGWKPSYRADLNVKEWFSGASLPTCSILLEKTVEQPDRTVDLYVEIRTTVQFSDYQQLHEPRAREVEPEKPPTPEKLFDIHFVPPKRTVVRILAEDENAACELAVDEFFQTGCLVRKPDAKKRPVFAWRLPTSGTRWAARLVKVPQ